MVGVGARCRDVPRGGPEQLEMEGLQEVMGWEGKAGKAAACHTATLGLTYQVRCFRMGKPNH